MTADYTGLNPAYHAEMDARREAHRHNRAVTFILFAKVPVPKQPNKYVPHYGAKELAKYARRLFLDAGR